MRCKHCEREIEENVSYCPYCGEKVTIEIPDYYCEKCGQQFQEDDVFCRNCGTQKETKGYVSIAATKRKYGLQKPMAKEHVLVEKIPADAERLEEPSSLLESSEVVHEEVDSENYFKNPIIWVVSIALLFVSIVLGLYVEQEYLTSYAAPAEEETNEGPKTKNDKIANADREDFMITQDTNVYAQQSNINDSGYVCYHNNRLYVATEQGVLQYNESFEEQETILEEKVSYIYVDDTYLYYADDLLRYHRMHLETKEKEKLMEEVYYPQHINGVLYYQNDDDNESLHSYHLETKEDKKLNDMCSYNTYIDIERNSIFYITYMEEDIKIYRMDLDGQNNEELVSQITFAFTYDGTNLYYEDDAGLLYAYNVTTKEASKLLRTSMYELYYLEGTLLYTDNNNELCTFVLEDENKKTIVKADMYRIQVIGEYAICWIWNGKAYGVYVVDTEGNCAHIVDDTIEKYNYDFDYDYDYDFDDGDEEDWFAL